MKTRDKTAGTHISDDHGKKSTRSSVAPGGSTGKAEEARKERADRRGGKARPVNAHSPRPGVAELLRRLVRQDKSDHLAVKLLPRIVFGIAAAFTLFHVASSSAAAFTGVAVLLATGLLCWLLRHRKQLLLALAGTLLTAAVTGYLAAAGDAARGVTQDMIGGQAVFGYWALAGMALLGAWMLKEHPGRRGVTVLLADGVLVIASVVGAMVPQAAVPIGFLGVITVLALRGRGIAVLRRRFSAFAAFLRRAGTRTRTGD